MGESNLIFQTADHELGNFVMINKEILMAMDENGNPLMSMESKGLFLTLMGLQGTNWNLTISGLAKITGWTKDTVTKYLNELIDAGYVIKHSQKFKPTSYIIFETVNRALWKISDIDTISSYPKISDTINSDTKISYPKNSAQYNININKENINKDGKINIAEKNRAETSFCNCNQNFSKDNISNSIHDSNHVSTYNKAFSEENNFIDSNGEKISGGVTKLNNPEKTSPKPKKKSTKTVKGTKKDGSTTKNKEELNAEKEKQNLSEILGGVNGKPLGEQTAEEKAVANLKDLANEKMAEIKEATQKMMMTQVKQTNRERKEKRIHTLIEKDYSDAEICRLFKNLITCLTEKGIGTTVTSYQQMKEDLEMGKSREEKINILKVAISYGVPHLASLFNRQNEYNKGKNKSVANNITPRVLTKEEASLARDENGNLLVF